MKLVIVESPAKAKTINKYLGSEYQVMASFGHIRDVPAKNNSVRPDDDFAMDWEMTPRGDKTVRDIVKALEKADALYLASDPDREGEAIAWHVVQELKRRKKLKADMPVYRVVFHEITKNAILEAIKNPRQIDMQLVDAYLARRALDYLVGFHISPLLWKKLPGAKSAGRVQSVALRLVCERENEIVAFKPQEYWGITVDLATEQKEKFSAKLSHIDNKKLDKFSLNNKEITDDVKAKLEKQNFSVLNIEKKQTKRNPAPPFTTSTLQQEASRKLGFGAKKTMQLAQKLYEAGLITYMRTDSINLSEEAIKIIRELIKNEYGESYLPDKARVYKNTSKNAQEAHEAIRPTNATRQPASLSIDADQKRLYELVWKRTLACQMESAVLDKVGIDILSADKVYQLRATGQTIAFPGFIKVYKEDIDDDKGEDDNTLLPPMKQNEALETLAVTAEQHFTEPPPRFSEASLVKKLEELGIGRPSTYATILSVLQDRAYVKLVNKRFVPEDRGQIVTAFLENYFNPYVQYDYTAGMEDKLDDITNGTLQWKDVLKDFWVPFDKTVKATEPHKMGEVLETVAKTLEHSLFPTEESKICPECKSGKLSLRVGRFGAFIGCSNYPNCKYTKQFATIEADHDENGQPIEPTVETENKTTILGKDANGADISVRKGPYGWYVQQGLGKDAKRVSLPKTINPESVDIKQALGLLTLPRVLGQDKDTKENIEAGIGRFGPYVKRGNVFQSLTTQDNVLTIDLNRAMELLATAKPKQEAKVLGKWQDVEITYQVGKYGPYVKWGRVMASAKKDGTIPTLDEAIILVQNKLREK